MSNVIKRREQQDAALQKAYTLCTDYDYLRLALEKTPVFGVVDYSSGSGSGFIMRDVVMIRKLADGWYQAGVRGISYCESIESEGWEGFVQQMRECNLAFVVPYAWYAVDAPVDGE
ncbi:hypothetical protein LJC48_01045 [Desulfovibrio sp. OttesenSCG-928-C06]|nr:hypothetical protein [Desulfovibrio sp. OttesenSCG-928-C06]